MPGLDSPLPSVWNPNLLLVDEILSVGDETFQQKCIKEMKSIQLVVKTVILMSHSSDRVRGFCDRNCLLDRGSLNNLGKPEEVLRSYHEILGRGRDPTEK